MIKTVGLLIAGTLALWLATAYPAHLLGGQAAVVYSAVAAGLCLVPAVGTLLWCWWALRNAPEQQLLGVLGGTGVRLLVVTGSAVALYLQVPYFTATAFMIWVIVFYLATLTLEVCLLLTRHLPAGPQRSP